MLRRGLGLIAVVLVLSACGRQDDKVKVSDGWRPEQVTITCPTGDCPQGIGVLVFLKTTDYGWYRVRSMSRCTATLISSTSVLTNSHCGRMENGYDEAYFIANRPGGSPQVARVGALVFDHSTRSIGIDRDISIFNLNVAMAAAPRSISRHIPEHMEEMVAFVINEGYSSDHTAFVLDKRVCRTEKRVSLYAAGVDDKKVGLALFDCDIQRGNSGSGVYTKDDFTHIQALLNSVYAYSSAAGNTIGRLRALFIDEGPAYLSGQHAMAERIHCLDVPGFPAPLEKCAMADLKKTVGDPFREAVKKEAERWLSSRAAGGDVQWTLEAFAGEIGFSLLGPAKQGAVLVPRPVCLNGNGGRINLEISYLQLGLQKDGLAVTRAHKTDRKEMRLARKGPEVKVSVSSARDDFYSYRGLRDEFMVKDRPRFTLLTEGTQTLQLPPCDAVSAQAAYEAAMKSIDSLNVGEIPRD